jgi:hypothetical protein
VFSHASHIEYPVALIEIKKKLTHWMKTILQKFSKANIPAIIHFYLQYYDYRDFAIYNTTTVIFHLGGYI